jgi:hypothetical protein
MITPTLQFLLEGIGAMRNGPILAGCVLAVTLTAGCSPYVYGPEIESFSRSVNSVRSSYQSGRDLAAGDFDIERQRAWLARREPFQITPNCASPAEPCRLVPISAQRRAAEEARRTQLAAEVANIQALGPVIDRLASYASALAAVTNQADRKAFDDAVGQLSKNATELVTAAAPFVGPSAAPAAIVIPTVIALGGQIAGTVLDAERFNALRQATTEAAPTISGLSTKIGDALDELAKSSRDRLLGRLLASTNVRRTGGQSYAEILAQTQADVDALNALRGVDGKALGKALGDAHTALRDALADPQRQLRPLREAVEALAKAAQAVADAFEKADGA